MNKIQIEEKIAKLQAIQRMYPPMDTTQLTEKVELAVLGAKDNEADTLSAADLLLDLDTRTDLIKARVTECAALYADMYGVPYDLFNKRLKESI